ncbi:molybdate ABC transporter substrate-binding protein [Chitinibacter bivalviorum]|uniref:Molybdate ABC transporter substrate-binding protein n=1 Tax=Chitinibacter bivalviorum TaxID=2739434 RepID=A0A7H9BL42_9NEIS|nr:molybdate ABC transporter substrate-binding protein [Chitinibacter bivalviorum]QLG89397.1 molybdate ABC transporter substrate-binding protein [Chitinibacter bivalviorum]
MRRLIILGLLANGVYAGEVKVAVASNFVAPLNALAADFKAASGHSLQISNGATGKLFAQISNGAPFEVLLAADDETPTQLVEQQLAAKDTQFTYATGRLVLWSAAGNTPNEQTLKQSQFSKLAIANPKVAPYGRAAMEVFAAQGLSAALSPKLVYGENIAQTQQFVASGNAQYGLIAASLVMFDGKFKSGKGWLVPAQLHQPIKQDAVLLKAGQNNAAATAFLQYLKSPAAKKIMVQYGYQ